MLLLTQHTSARFGPRTFANAYAADLTVAIAVDFSTSGEKLTKKAAGDRFVELDYRNPWLDNARTLYRTIGMHRATKLNIAGNGIYTFVKYDFYQSEINQYLYNLLAKVHAHRRIEHIRSGGQTGMDWAGLVAAVKLGIDCEGHFPNGFRQRDIDNNDMYTNEADLRDRIAIDVDQLVRN